MCNITTIYPSIGMYNSKYFMSYSISYCDTRICRRQTAYLYDYIALVFHSSMGKKY